MGSSKYKGNLAQPPLQSNPFATELCIVHKIDLEAILQGHPIPRIQNIVLHRS